MKRFIAAVVAIPMLLAVVAAGIERDAVTIDTAELTYESYKEMNIVSGIARVERAVYGESGWAILAAAGAGVISYDGATSPDLWYVGGGLKRHLTDYTSVSFMLDYQWANGGDEYKVMGGKLEILQRLLPADRPLSPYLRGSAAIADASIPMWGTSAVQPDNFTALILELSVGCDFALGKECSLVVQGSFRDSSGLTDGIFAEQYADGYSALVALKYYWF